MNAQTVADAAEIRKLVDAQKNAMHDKNSAAAVAHFTPDAVVFDLAPPLRSIYGANAGKMQEWMDGWEGRSRARHASSRSRQRRSGVLVWIFADHRPSQAGGARCELLDAHDAVPGARRGQMEGRALAYFRAILHGWQPAAGFRSAAVVWRKASEDSAADRPTFFLKKISSDVRMADARTSWE